VAEPLRCLPADTLITGWDFSTGAVKCLAFDLDGQAVAEVRLPTDLWTEGGVSELSLLQLEGQAVASTRAIVERLRELGRLAHWRASGISATHHTAGRIDRARLPVRRAICWNDQTLPTYHARGLARLGGPERVVQLIGGPYASRYSLSHLVKDAQHLSLDDWRRTYRMLPHGSLAAGYLTGNFDVVSVSAAASTGLMDLRTNSWCRPMLDALEKEELQELAWAQLPRIIEQTEPVGRLAPGLAVAAGIDPAAAPLIFPTSDDQQAGLVGGGAVDAGQLAVVLGNSAVVNSSSEKLAGGALDVMRLNWGPYLWMRCFNNGAQFLDPIVGASPDWKTLEVKARACPPGAGGVAVLPFAQPEPSLGVKEKCVRWFPAVVPADEGVRYRAALEALAYLIGWGVREHESAGQNVTRITVSGGIARSDLMCEVLASVLERPLYRLVSSEGPALGAAVTALAALETHLRAQQNITAPYTVADAVERMVKFRGTVEPNPAWVGTYRAERRAFESRITAR
jgi:sugar (pentulose or hexulose) kinase